MLTQRYKPLMKHYRRPFPKIWCYSAFDQTNEAPSNTRRFAGSGRSENGNCEQSAYCRDCRR